MSFIYNSVDLIKCFTLILYNHNLVIFRNIKNGIDLAHRMLTQCVNNTIMFDAKNVIYCLETESRDSICILKYILVIR